MPLSSTAIDAAGRPIDPASYYRISVGRVYEWSAWGGRLDYVELDGFQFTRSIAISAWLERREAREFEQLCETLRRTG